MSDCRACDLARTNVQTCHYESGCPSCNARSLAQSPAFFDSMQQGSLTDTYKRALSFFFPNKDASAVHSRIKGFAALIEQARRGV